MNLSVSVIIPTFNRALLLQEAIASVLSQTYAPAEILVVDDGSTDDTREIVGAFGDRVQYFYQTNRGPAAARNVGIQNARGDVLAFLDADDLWVPQALEWGVARLENQVAPYAEIVSGLTQRIERVEQATGEFTYEPILPTWALLSFCSAFCRREVFAQVGLIDEDLRYGEDVDWFLRAREQSIPMTFLEQVTHLYRIHENNLMNDTRTANMYLLRALQKSLARRVQANGGKISALAELTDLDVLNKIVYGAKG